MRIVFVDFDGVLNSELFYKNNSIKDITDNIDPFCVRQLNAILEKTGAKVVVSSSWAKLMDDEELNRILTKHGFEGEIVGFVPSLSLVGETESSAQASVPRGLEIKNWIETNQDIIGEKCFNYNDYAILDDDSDMLLEQMDNFFQTDPYVGITPFIVDRVVTFLNGKKDFGG